MSSTPGRAKEILYGKLTSAEMVVNEIMTSCSLVSEDKIALLLSNIQIRLHGIGDTDYAALSELQDIYVNLIVGVMHQDMLESSDEIGLLSAAIRKRIDNFDLFYEQLEKGTFKGPF